MSIYDTEDRPLPDTATGATGIATATIGVDGVFIRNPDGDDIVVVEVQYGEIVVLVIRPDGNPERVVAIDPATRKVTG